MYFSGVKLNLSVIKMGSTVILGAPSVGILICFSLIVCVSVQTYMYIVACPILQFSETSVKALICDLKTGKCKRKD